MKRVQYHRYGGPEELRVEEVALPEPGDGQIRVRVRAAAANPMDWKIRKGEMKMMTGRRFPRGLGHDFAGVVEAVGPNVTRFKPGDEVFGATGLKESGTFAEALVTEDKTVFLKPQSLSFEEAAALPIVSATAWTALIDKARLQAGQRVFITGCLGGVGRIAARIATMRGAEIAGSCSASWRDEALALGVRGGCRLSRLQCECVSRSLRRGIRYARRAVVDPVRRDAQTRRRGDAYCPNARKDDLEHALVPASDGFRPTDAAIHGRHC